jgi:hypothetical protein
MSNKEFKKAKIRISQEDWKTIKGLTKSHNQSIVDPLESINQSIVALESMKPSEVAAAILHLALNKFAWRDIISELIEDNII